AAFVLGAIALATFAIWERRAPEPMLPGRLLRIRAFTAANATGFLQSAALFSAAFLAAQYFQLGLGFSPLAAGLRFLPSTPAPASPRGAPAVGGGGARRHGPGPGVFLGAAAAGGGVRLDRPDRARPRVLPRADPAVRHRRCRHLDGGARDAHGGAQRCAARR